MKVLMVCLGNICRSPLAEGVMDALARTKGIEVSVDSAGTSAFHQGENPDGRSIEVARDHGIQISHQRSRPVLKSDFEDFDLILAMDEKNLQNLKDFCPNPQHLTKVRLLIDGHNVPDPYYEGGFEYVFEMVKKGCEDWIEKIENRKI